MRSKVPPLNELVSRWMKFSHVTYYVPIYTNTDKDAVGYFILGIRRLKLVTESASVGLKKMEGPKIDPAEYVLAILYHIYWWLFLYQTPVS